MEFKYDVRDLKFILKEWLPTDEVAACDRFKETLVSFSFLMVPIRDRMILLSAVNMRFALMLLSWLRLPEIKSESSMEIL